MKCSKCLANLDSTDCYCPSCGKKNPFVSVTAHNNVLFHLHLDDDIEVKEADVPTYNVSSAYPLASKNAAKNYSTPLNAGGSPAASSAGSSAGTSAGKNAKTNPAGCVMLIVFLFVLISFIVTLLD